jgi:SAM-dependent methyltransferase
MRDGTDHVASGSGDLERRMADVVSLHGPWQTHNIRLADGVFTISPQPQTTATKLARIVQVISDVCGDLHGLRVLDIGCNEGLYALELASRGASVLGVDARQAHIEKARFAAAALGLEVAFEQLDMRDIDPDRHGRFDLVVASGIFYHLDAPDLFAMVERLAAMTSRLLIDAHVSPYAQDVAEHDGESYHGMFAQEHAATTTEAERLAAGRQSFANERAFHITRPSLLRLLEAAGFTSVLEVQLPRGPERLDTRTTLLAVAGERAPLGVVPAAHVGRGRALPEQAAPSPAELRRLRRRSRLRRLRHSLRAPSASDESHRHHRS